jgi:hypothetical protein
MNLPTDQRRDADAPRTTPPPSCCLGWHQTATTSSVHREDEMDQQGWNERTRRLLERPYLQARTGPAGSGCGHDEAGWELLRRPVATAFHRSGTWLDVGCANGYLLETLPTWIAGRGFALEPFGLELIPSVADLARTRLPNLAERIYTGDVTQWEPPRRWTFITALTDAVPPGGLPGLVYRLLDRFAEPGGRVIISSYGSSRRREPADAVAERLTADRFEVAGFAQAIESGIIVTQTAWIDADLRPRRVC